PARSHAVFMVLGAPGGRKSVGPGVGCNTTGQETGRQSVTRRLVGPWGTFPTCQQHPARWKRAPQELKPLLPLASVVRERCSGSRCHRGGAGFVPSISLVSWVRSEVGFVPSISLVSRIRDERLAR